MWWLMVAGGFAADLPVIAVVQRGHAGEVGALEVGPDGRLLSGGEDGVVRLWDDAGRLVRELATDFPLGEVGGVAFSPDGRTAFATGSVDVVSWDLATARQGPNLHPACYGAGPITISARGRVAVGCADGGISVHDLARPDAEPLLVDSGAGRVFDLAWSPNGKRLLVGGSDAWVVVDGDRATSIAAADRYEPFLSVAWSPDGRVMAGARDGGALIRDRRGELRELYDPRLSGPPRLAWQDDGALVASRSAMTAWDAATGEVRWTTSELAEHDATNALALAPDGGLAAADGSGTIRWYEPDGRLRAQLPRGPAPLWAVAADGLRIATGSETGHVAVWNLATLRLDAVVQGHDGVADDAAFTPSGALLTCGHDGQLVVRGADLAEVSRPASGLGVCRAILARPDGALMAASDFGTARIVGAEPPEWIAESAFTIDALPDGTLLTASRTDGARLHAAEPVTLDPRHEVVAVSPDGGRALTGHRSDGGAGGLRMLDLATRTALWEDEAAGAGAAAFSPDGSLVAVADGKVVLLLDAATGRLRELFSGHELEVKDVAFADGGRLLVSASLDGTAKVWDLATREALTLLTDGREWLVVSADGLFDGSPGAASLLAMAQGDRSFGIDQLVVTHNRPDLLLERFGLGSDALREHYRRKAERRLAKAGVAADVYAGWSTGLPDATITAVRPRGAGRVRIEAELEDAEGLASWQVWANGVPLFDGVGEPVSGRAARVRADVALAGGPETLEVSAFSSRGLESGRARAVVEGLAAPGRLIFLGFGVSDYADDRLDLGYAAQDARDLAAAFAALPGYAGVHAHVFTDADVTPDRLREVKALLAEARPEDTLVVFVAGHGLHDDDPARTWYFLPHGADLGDLAGTAAPFELVEDLVVGVAPRRKLLLMDACESGEAEDEGAIAAPAAQLASRSALRTSRRITAPPPWLLERDRLVHLDVARRSGAIVFSSSRGGEASYESAAIANGWFTEAVLEALGTPAADADGDGAVSTDELRAYVSAAVAAGTADRQHPTVDRDNIAQRFAFPLAR